MLLLLPPDTDWFKGTPGNTVMAMVALTPRPRSLALMPRIRMSLRTGRISRVRTPHTDVEELQDECSIVSGLLALSIA